MAFSVAAQAVAASLIAVFLLVFVTGVALVLLNRDRPTIRQRQPIIVIGGVTGFATWVVAILAQIVVADKIDCATSTFFSHIAMGFAVDFYIWRALVLFVHYHSTQQKLKAPARRTSSTRTAGDRELTTIAKRCIQLDEEASRDKPRVALDIGDLDGDQNARAPLSPKTDNSSSNEGGESDAEDDDIDSRQTGPNTGTWITRHKHLVQWQYAGAAIVVVLSLQIAGPFLLLHFRFLSFGTKFAQGCNFPIANITFFAELLAYASTFATIGYQLSKAHFEDNLFIKAELKFLAAFAAIASLPWFLVAMIAPAREFAMVTYPIVPFYSAMIGCIMVCVSIYFPLYKCYRLAVLEAQETTQTLTGVLSTPEGRDAFAQFLAGEFSPENLMFWLDSQSYSRMATACEQLRFSAQRTAQLRMLREAKRIWAKYFAKDSISEVNVSGACRDDMLAFLAPHLQLASAAALAAKRDSKVAKIDANMRKQMARIADQGAAATGGRAMPARSVSIGIATAATSAAAAMHLDHGYLDDAHSQSQAKFEDDLGKVFLNAEIEVFNLMDRDSFRRFVASHLFAKLCVTLEKSARGGLGF